MRHAYPITWQGGMTPEQAQRLLELWTFLTAEGWVTPPWVLSLQRKVAAYWARRGGQR